MPIIDKISVNGGFLFKKRQEVEIADKEFAMKLFEGGPKMPYILSQFVIDLSIIHLFSYIHVIYITITSPFMSRESSRLIFSSSPPFYEYSFQSIVAVEDTPYDIAQRRKKVLLNYILCIRFISKMYSIVNVSQFSYTNLSQGCF